jgi:hypothetical protein
MAERIHIKLPVLPQWLLIINSAILLIFSNVAFSAERVALVIGNSAYLESPLPNPANDARLVATTLRGLGFDVVERIDADQKTMKRAIQEFGGRLTASGRSTVGLFYYAGHGVQVNNENYLVPVNADIRRESDVTIEAVNATAVLSTLNYARNDLNFVIMDACRNNPYASSSRSGTRGLARMDAPRGTLIAYSTSPGTVAMDGDGNNSPYTEALAAAMQRPGLPVEQMFKQVRRQVMAATSDFQVPWEASSLTGDFFFNSAGGNAAVAANSAAAYPTNNSATATSVRYSGSSQAMPSMSGSQGFHIEGVTRAGSGKFEGKTVIEVTDVKSGSPFTPKLMKGDVIHTFEDASLDSDADLGQLLEATLSGAGGSARIEYTRRNRNYSINCKRGVRFDKINCR